MSVEIEWGRWRPAPEPKPGVFDIYKISREDARRNPNLNSRTRYLEDEYDIVNDAVKAATGKKLLNPFRVTNEEASRILRPFGADAQREILWLEKHATKKWFEEFDKLAKAYPDKADWAKLRNQAVKRYREKRRAAEENYMKGIDAVGLVTGQQIPYVGKVPFIRDVAAAFYNTFTHPLYTGAQFAGSLAAQIESPLDLIVIVGTGLTGSAPKSLIWNASRAAAVNAAGQAILEPVVQANRADAGQEHGLGMAIDNITGAAALGFVLDLGVRGPSRAVVKRYGRDTPAGTFGSKHGRGGLFLDAKPEIKAPRPVVRDRPSEDALKKAESGDVEALKEVATKTGAIEDPAVKGALDYLELGGRIDEEAMARLKEMGIANPEGVEFMARILRGEHSREPAPIPKAKKPLVDDPEITTRLDELDSRMKNLDQATKALIHKAAEAGIPEIVAALKKGPDAMTRAIEEAGGAQVLADRVTVLTSRDVVETAMALRRSPDAMDSNVPIESGFIRTARSIATLEDSAFARVLSGDVPASYAALVADLVEPARHSIVMDVVKNATDMNEARAAIQEVADLPRPVKKGSVSSLDDPSGPNAKKQTEKLEASMKNEVDDATLPIQHRDELERKAETLRGEIAKLEGGEGKAVSNYKTSQATEFDTYKDPATGEVLQAAEVDSIIDMWRFVNEARKQKKPQQLSSFLVESGRIKDEHGELSNILGGKSRYLISANGLSLDDAALLAWEKGFFTGSNRPTIAEFLDALDRDVRGEKQFSALEHDRVEDVFVANEMAADLDELGVLGAKNESEIRQYFRSGEGKKRSGSSEASLKGTAEPHEATLAAKRAELYKIESDLAATNARIMGAAGAEVYRIVMDRLNVQRMVDITKTINDAISFARGIVPEGTKIDVVPELNLDGVRLDASSNDVTGHIKLAMHALDPTARLGHEALHTLVTRGLISPDEVSLLAKAARDLDLFVDADGKPLEPQYKTAYEGRKNAARLIEEEAAASLIEAKIKGLNIDKEVKGVLNRVKDFFRQLAVQLGALKFRTADEVAVAMLTGEMAQRRARARWRRDGGVGNIGDLLAALKTPKELENDLLAAANKKLDRILHLGIDDKFFNFEKYLEDIGMIRFEGGDDFPIHASFVLQRKIPDSIINKNKSSYEYVKWSDAPKWMKDEIYSDGFNKPDEIKDSDLELRIADYDPDRDPEDGIGFVELHLADAWKVEQRLKDKLKSDVSPKTVDDVLKFPQHHVRAAAFVTWLDANSVPYRIEGSPDVASVYYYVDLDLSDDPQTIKVRFADHERQSTLHLPADYNIYVDSNEGLTSIYDDNELRAAITKVAEVWSNANLIRKPKQKDTLFAISPSQKRSIDDLGYYSHALESAKVLKQAKGTPEQMLAQLKKAGVKDGEIEATGLRKFLDGKKSVTRDEIIKHLEDSRVALNEVQYVGKREPMLTGDDILLGQHGHPEDELLGVKKPKYQSYSLDANNPTYRETVLHLPVSDESTYIKEKLNSLYDQIDEAGFDRRNEIESEIKALSKKKIDYFYGGHFDEPNITGHLMTSMVTDHKGRSVFNVDQIQSDWGQRLRDGGVRDEAKIARLKKELEEIYKERKSETNGTDERFYDNGNVRYEGTITFAERFSNILDEKEKKALAVSLLRSDRSGIWTEGFDSLLRAGRDDIMTTETAKSLKEKVEANAELQKALKVWENAFKKANKHRLKEAELATAEAAATGNPLVNTTDQWVNTTLRRALKLAIDSDADAISIPSGETVLSYNHGDTHGMNEFYNKIVPKNLRKILNKFDKSIKPEHIETVDSPSGEKDLGKGFTVFPITEKVRNEIVDKGQPLFALRNLESERRSEAAHGINRGAIITVDRKAVSAVFEAVVFDLIDLPETITAGTMSRVAKAKQTGVNGEALVAAEFLTLDGQKFRKLIPYESLFGDTVFRALSFVRDGRGFIGFVNFSADGITPMRVAGELAHERVHLVRRLDMINETVFDRLVDHAKKLRVLDYSLSDYAGIVGSVDDGSTKSLYSAYSELYHNRADKIETINQEYVAHMVELYTHGAIKATELAPVAQELKAVMGDISGQDIFALSEPGLGAEMAMIDRMSVIKEMVEACRG